MPFWKRALLRLFNAKTSQWYSAYHIEDAVMISFPLQALIENS